MKSWLRCAVALTALVAAGRAPCAAEDAPRVLTYRAVSPSSGTPLSLDAAKTAAALVVRRCAHAGIDGVTTATSTSGDAVEIRLPAAIADREADVKRFVDRPGLVEFRIRAETSVEDEWRDRRLQGGAAPPAGYEWRLPEDGVMQMLVETPEKAAAAKVADLAKKKGVAQDSPEMTAALADVEKARRESVFTNERIGATSVTRTMSTIGGQWLRHVTVRFEFKDEAKAAFEKFTGDHVRRVMCVVVDGKVHVSPTIPAALPGAGELRAPGTGYTEEQAQEMAAILESGPLPCRLVAVKEK